MVLALTFHFGCPIRQLEVQNAFLHGHLYEEAYMQQPPDFVDPMFPTHVCRYMASSRPPIRGSNASLTFS